MRSMMATPTNTPPSHSILLPPPIFIESPSTWTEGRSPRILVEGQKAAHVKRSKFHARPKSSVASAAYAIAPVRRGECCKKSGHLNSRFSRAAGLPGFAICVRKRTDVAKMARSN